MIAKCVHQCREGRLARTVAWGYVINLRRIVKQRHHLSDRLIGRHHQVKAARNQVDVRVDSLRRRDDPI